MSRPRPRRRAVSRAHQATAQPTGERKTIWTAEHLRFMALVRAVREGAGLTQAEVGRRMERDQTFISKVETGERRLDVPEFIRLCRACERDPREVLAEIMDFPDLQDPCK